MKTAIFRGACVAGLLLGASGASAQQTAFAIGNGGTSLVRFQTDNPSNVTVVGTFGGAASFLDALDFRPATGQLYGYLDSTDSFYTVDLATGQLTLASIGASGAPTNTFQLGLDFNPTIDRARIVTDSGQNIVFNPGAGTAQAFTNVFFGAGDVNVNASPSLIDNAYTQNFVGAASTRQYAIDYGLDALVTVDNNNGTLATVGSLGVNTDIFTGFDITTVAGTDTAYAIMMPVGGTSGLYTISLTTGQATLVGGLGFTNQVYSLAIVPAPASAMIVGPALLVMRRRRR